MAMFPNLPTDNFIKFLTLLTLAGTIYCFSLCLDDNKVIKSASESYRQLSVLTTLLTYKADHADILNKILHSNTEAERKQAIKNIKWDKDTVHSSSIKLGIAYEVIYLDTTKEIMTSRLKGVIDDMQDIEKKMILARPDDSYRGYRGEFIGHIIATILCFLSFNLFAGLWYKEQKKHDKILDLQIRKLELELPPAPIIETPPTAPSPANPESQTERSNQ